MQKVEASPILPFDQEAFWQEMNRLLPDYGSRLNAMLAGDGSEAMTGPLKLMSYTTAGRPAASSATGGIIFVSDAAAGSKFQGSDGVGWVSLG
jgi:hypothetical protein